MDEVAALVVPPPESSTIAERATGASANVSCNTCSAVGLAVPKEEADEERAHGDSEKERAGVLRAPALQLP